MTLDLAVLVSGRGSNLQALVDAIGDGRLDARIVGVFCDRSDAPALQRARSAGIATRVVAARGFATRLEHDAALFEAIDAARPDLIVCAGYMRLISEREVQAGADGSSTSIRRCCLPSKACIRTRRHWRRAWPSMGPASTTSPRIWMEGR
jgi:phosphoribosylglycinamide formyltransferase-1